jgi:HJR/Mrr/RecB family endonuclease
MKHRYRITANDVSEAAAEVQRQKKIWEGYGGRLVTDQEIEDANRYAARADAEIQKLHSKKYKLNRARVLFFQVVSVLLRIFGLNSIHRLAGGLLLATPIFCLTALLLIAATKNFPLVIAVSLFSYLLSAAALTFFLYPASNADLGQEVEKMRQEAVAVESQLRVLKSKFQGWWDRYCNLLAIRRAKEKYEAARVRHQELTRLLRSRRYQLIHTDWRSLRGVAFENFLGNVFEELGYSVEKTKTTGDQGVDLILTGKGRRMAVQAKGYKESVGNGSVQEVYAGMTFYKCDECVAVTNSYFTVGAIDLARSVGCQLIDATRMPDLIDGQVL